MRVPVSLRLPVLALAAVVALPVLAAKDARVSGVGVRKCTEWNEWKEQKKGEPRAVAVEWALGFVAGHNVYTRAETTPAQVSPNARTVATLLDSYCEKRVDDPLLLGVIDMVKNLGGSSVNLTPKARPGRSDGKPET
jgi:hypothetical protein